MEKHDRVIDFIRKEILFEEPNASLDPETPLLDGVIDSLGLMQLVAFLEEEFEIEIDDGEIVAANFRTITAIGGLIDEKLVAVKG